MNQVFVERSPPDYNKIFKFTSGLSNLVAIIVTLIVSVLITSHICFILEESSSMQMVRVGLNVVRQTIGTINNILLQFFKTIIVILLVFIIVGLGRIGLELLNPLC